MFSRSLPCHAIGGMEAVAWDTASGLAALGHRVRVVTTAARNERGCAVPKDLEGRLEVVCLEGTAPGRYSLAWWRLSRRYYSETADSFRPDAVFSVSVGAGAVLPLLGPVPSLMQVHGTSIGEFESKIRSGRPISLLKSPYNLLCVPRDLRFYRHVTRAVAVGPAVLSALSHPLIRMVLSADRVTLIPNGIDTGLFKEVPGQREKVRERLGIPAGVKAVISVSRLNVQKGTHLALEAFSRLDSRDARFIVVGDGPEAGRLKGLASRLGIAGRTVFTGAVDQSSLPGLLSSADAFVFTSTRVEGLPLNVLEAMSVGLPSVVSRHLVESLEGASSVSGVYAVDPEDPGEVASALESALAFGEPGRREFIESKYSKRRMVALYEDLLLSLA